MQKSYLAHHGIKGMKWGVRRFEDASGHLTPAGKRRYGVQDARKYYKINRLQRAKEKNRDPDKGEQLSRRIRRVQTRSDRKHADLNQRDINVGRQIVAKNRRNWAMVGTAAKAAATAAGAYALYQNPKTRALAPLAIAGGAALTFGSAKKVPYYTMEARRYKQVNPKGATKQGLTKKQQAIRKAGKIAAGAALAAGAGYALYKTGAVNAAINRGRNALGNGINNPTSVNQNGSTQPNSANNSNATQATNTSNNTGAKTTQARKAATDTVREKASQAKQAASDKAKTAVRNKVMDGVDTDDVRTYANAVANAKSLAEDARRYAQAVKAVKNKDAISALSAITPEIVDYTNDLIERSKDQINKRKK